MFSAALNLTNEWGQVRSLSFVATKAHAEFKPALVNVQHSLDQFGHPQPRVVYTDNPLADKNFLESVFPSLLEDVVPVEKYASLEVFKLPSMVQVVTHDTATGINGACAAILSDLDAATGDTPLIVGLDAEWNYSTGKHGTQQPISVVQIACRNRVDIFQVCHCFHIIFSKFHMISGLRGNLPLVMQRLLSSAQIHKVGRNINQDLRRLESECHSTVPFVGGIELARLAKDRGVITDARLGLKDICAAVLQKRLDKSNGIRSHSDWSSAELSEEQIQYAAQDVYVSLQIYSCLIQIVKPSPLLPTALPGTCISLLHDDGVCIAMGILSLAPRSATCAGINITKTRERITVEKVLVPGAILPFHDQALQAFGTPPFDIVAKKNKLTTRSDDLSPPSLSNPLHPPLTSSDSALASLDAQGESKIADFLSEAIPMDNNLGEDVDDPHSDHEDEEQSLADVDLDLEIVEVLDKCLVAAPTS